MNFVARFLESTNLKNEIYNLILVIIYALTKMVYYKLVKVTIDVPG